MAVPALSRRKLLSTAMLAAPAVMLGPMVARGRETPLPVDAAEAFAPEPLDQALTTAEGFSRIHSLIIARNAEPYVERRFRGPALDATVNIKSASKAIISTLVGIAIDRGVLDGPDQRIGALLADRIPDGADPRVRDITLGMLMSMQAGLERTSGRHYGRWVSSNDWVAFVLGQPMVDEPGGQMLYSTGNTHLISAILTRESGESTLALARSWLGGPLGVAFPPWDRDPQGIYLGGNNMGMSPRGLLRFGEMIRQGGTIGDTRVVSRDWIDTALEPRTRSRYTDHGHGYGWFRYEADDGTPIHYAWGFGGQMVYVIPDIAVTVVVTSDPYTGSATDRYNRALHAMVADHIVPAARRADA